MELWFLPELHLPGNGERDFVLNVSLANNSVLLPFSSETASLYFYLLCVLNLAKGIISYFYLVIFL